MVTFQVAQFVSQHRLHLGRLQQLKERRVHHDERLPSGDRERVCVGAWVLRKFTVGLCGFDITSSVTSYRSALALQTVPCTHGGDDRHAAD